jgi:RNA polymerase sigma-70 factor (ECF subfamily)
MSFVNSNISRSEHELFRDFRHGEKKVFDYFFDKYYQGLCVYAYRMLKSKSDAEDVVEDFFVRILENRNNITIESSVKSYFMRSVHNRCLDYIAHQKVVINHELFRQQIMSEDDFREYPLIDTELQFLIEKAIQNLPDGIRETFILNRFEGLKYQQIADQENISVKTVEYRISKALNILRKEFGDYLILLIFAGKF